MNSNNDHGSREVMPAKNPDRGRGEMFAQQQHMQQQKHAQHQARTIFGRRAVTNKVATAAVAVAAVPVALLAACSTGNDAAQETKPAMTGESSARETIATAALKDANGGEVGTATFAPGEGKEMTITVDAKNLTPGFHGFHVHNVAKCEADSSAPGKPEKKGDFLSAGGHLHLDGQGMPADGHSNDHGHSHGTPASGDLPSLLVGEDGTAHMTVTTDRLTKDGLFAGEGTSLIIHEDADNHANIPERYAPEGPDKDTLSTGDAGGRVACGVIQR